MRSTIAFALVSSSAWSAIAFAQAPPAPPEAKQCQSTTVARAPAAQDSDTDGAADDIVVTALKRNDTALTTPASITILSEQALVSHNVTAANQLNGIVPGLTMSVGVNGSPGTSFRGLGSNSAVFSLEPSVAQYQDGVYFGHARDYVAPLYDVDHVEFIRGTQSTLLGKNTSLGAISIVNHRPTADFDYLLRATHSFSIDGDKAEAALNLPVSDRLKIRGAFLAARDQGYFQNVYKGRSEARQDDLSGRLLAAWTLPGSFDILLSYQHDYRRLRGQALEAVSDPAGVVLARASAVGAPFDTGAIGITGSASDPRGGTVTSPDPYDRANVDRLNLIANIYLDGFTITLQTAYTNSRSRRSTDLDFTAANLFNITDSERSRTFSQELRLSSPAGDPFDYLVGLYYYQNDWDYARTFGSSPSNTVGFPFTGAAVSMTSLPTKAYSAFAAGTFEIIQGVKIDGGLRYTHERKSGDFVRNSSGTLGGPFPTTPFSVYAAQVTDPLDYNIGLRFEPSARVLLYGSYSKGTKSGGYQDAPTTIAGAAFAPETAYTAEIGAKLRLAGGSFTAALFNTRVKGFQTSYTAAVGTPPVSQTVVGNSNVRSRGFEANAAYALSAGFRLNGSLVYANSVFTDPFPASTAIARKGDRLTRAPKWSGSLEASYETPVTDNLRAFGGASMNFASDTLYQFRAAQPLAPIGSRHALIDARIGIRGKDERWELMLLGTNLTSKRYIEFATSISAGGGAYYGSFNRPRVIALQLAIKN